MFSYANARPNETALIEYFEAIGVNWEDIAKSLLGWMSDDEVREWAEREDYDIFDDEEEEETEIRPLIYHNLADYKKYKCSERNEKYWIAAWSWNVGSIIKDNIVIHQYKGIPIDQDYIERKEAII